MSIQGWFPLGLTGLISLQSKGLSRVFYSTAIQKHKFFDAQPFFMVQLSLPHKTTGKIIALTIWTFVGKVMALFYNTLSRFVIAFLPRSKCLHFKRALTAHSDFGAQEKKSIIVSTFSPSICHEVMKPDVMVLVFGILSFKPDFSLSAFICRLTVHNFDVLWYHICTSSLFHVPF